MPSTSATRSAIRSLFSRSRRPKRVLRCSIVAGRSMAETVPPQPYQTGTVSQVLPAPAELATRRLRLAAVVEEAVDRRPGAADVGTEGAVPEQHALRAERRRGRSAAAPRGRVAAARRRAPRRDARGAPPSPRRRRARRRRRRRPQSTPWRRRSGARARSSSPAAGRAARASSRRRGRAAGRRRGRTGRRRRRVAATARSSAGVERLGQRLVREPERRRRVGAAAAEPGRDRDPLGDRRRPARLDAGGGGERARARRGRSCRRRSRSTVSAAPGATATRSARSTRCSTVATSCLPSARGGPTTSARLIFAGAGALTEPRRARRTPAARALRHAPPVGGRSTRAPPLRRSREQSPASASEFGSVLRRWANEASTTCLIRAKSSGSGTRRKATSAESTFGGGRKTVRETGMEAGALGGELDEHRDAAVRLRRRDREEAVGDLALHHHRPELERGQPGEALGDDRRRDVVGQVRDELGRASDRARRGRAGARRPSAGRRSGRSASSARCGASERSSSTAWTCPARSARRLVRTPRPGPISSTTSSAPSSARRSITPRMFSSARKCWPSCFFGRTLTAGGRRRRRWRRCGLRARRRPRRGPSASAATVWTTCAGSFGRPRTGCGAR